MTTTKIVELDGQKRKISITREKGNVSIRDEKTRTDLVKPLQLQGAKGPLVLIPEFQWIEGQTVLVSAATLASAKIIEIHTEEIYQISKEGNCSGLRSAIAQVLE